MPACKPLCPVVKSQLKKIVAESPWILDVNTKISASTAKKRDADLQTEQAHKVGNRRHVATDAVEVSLKHQATMPQNINTGGHEGHDNLLTTATVGHRTIEHTSKLVGSSASRIGKDQETMREGSLDDIDDTTVFQDECEPSCPRRISREIRRPRLQQRQRVVDAYLLNKGTGYFENVCTCSLSCVVRALRDDTFFRSILRSAVVFSLGLKLCSELDAWYLPIRFS